MPAPLALAALAVVAVGGGLALASGGGTASRTRRPRDPDSPAGELAQLIARADDFQKTIDKAAADPSRPDFAALATKANEAKAAAEAETRAYIGRTVDKYRDAIVTGLTYTGIGLALVPFVYAGAVLAKWAGNAQLTLMKLVFGGASDGWSEDWVANLNYELDWLASHAIPFPGWHEGKGWNSPMGYVNGGGGSECGSGGLCSMREAFEKMPDDQRARAFLAMQSIRRNIERNPISLAFYAQATSMSVAWTEAPDATIQKLLPASLATSIAQDMDVPFTSWARVEEVTRRVMAQAAGESEREGWRWPIVVALSYGYSYAVWASNEELARVGKVAVLRRL